MAEEITDLNKEIEGHIKGLETRKAELLDRISKLNGRLRYKQHERDALMPFLEQTKDVRIGPIRKDLRNLEFRIATQAYTPKIEKELVKQVKKLEAELSKVSEVEKARRKKMLVDGDIEQAQREIASIEPELKKIRDELNDHYESMRTERKQAKKGIKSDHMVTLEDIAVFENEEE
jgi:uncharacterized coiled-coil DUF342 family protein